MTKMHKGVGMPWSGLDWGLDLDHTELHLRCSPVWGVVPDFPWRCGLGFGVGWVSCAPGPNQTAPQTCCTILIE
jgi:hypothetical protein